MGLAGGVGAATAWGAAMRISMSVVRVGRIAAMLLLALLASSGIVTAQTTERQRAFVYGINAAFGTNVTGSFAPPSVNTIYILADRQNILSPRMTEIYFWPITNEYQAEWSSLNEPVPGTLEILQNGQIIKQTQPTSYTIQYKPRGADTDATIYIDDQARQVHAAFTTRQKDYQEASRTYMAEQQAWFAIADELNRKAQAGEKVTIPPQPQPPDPIDVFSNGLNTGVPMQLPAGSYQIRLRQPDSTILPGSERQLEVFAPRRTAIGYIVLPESRWTTPEEVTDLNDVIVGKVNSRIYLVPRLTREYPARAYALLENPQSQIGESSDWKWVNGEPVATSEMELLSNGQVVERRKLTPYRVRQVDGPSLGYEVLEFKPDPERPKAAPDFTGYPLMLTQPGSAYSIRLLSTDGTPLADSSRLVRAPSGISLGVLLLLVLLPFGLGAVIILRRKRRLRLPRNLAG